MDFMLHQEAIDIPNIWIEEVRRLIEEKNSNVEQNNRSLHRAIEYGHRDIVALFLTHGADIETKNSTGDTPLLLACKTNGRLSIVKLLIEQGADIHAVDGGGNSCLHVACMFGDKEVMELLLKHGTNPNATNNLMKHTPLHLACDLGDLEKVETLLIGGAYPDQGDCDGETPLVWARNAPCKKAVIEVLENHIRNKEQDQTEGCTTENKLDSSNETFRGATEGFEAETKILDYTQEAEVLALKKTVKELIAWRDDVLARSEGMATKSELIAASSCLLSKKTLYEMIENSLKEYFRFMHRQQSREEISLQKKVKLLETREMVLASKLDELERKTEIVTKSSVEDMNVSRGSKNASCSLKRSTYHSCDAMLNDCPKNKKQKIEKSRENNRIVVTRTTLDDGLEDKEGEEGQTGADIKTIVQEKRSVDEAYQNIQKRLSSLERRSSRISSWLGAAALMILIWRS